MIKFLPAFLAILIVAVVAWAERPPQSREKAKLVVTGTVKKITTTTKAFGGDGVQTDYSAELVVDAVDKGEGVKVGDTMTVTWFHVTKNPTRNIAGAFGHGYAI